MNPVEQQERRTAIQQLRAELDKVIADFEARVKNELAGEAALRKLHLTRLETRLSQEAVTVLAAATCKTIAATEPIRRGFWGRQRWLWFGT